MLPLPAALGSFQLIEKIRFHIHHRGLDPGKVASCPVRPASDQLLLLVTRALAVDPERHIQIPIGRGEPPAELGHLVGGAY